MEFLLYLSPQSQEIYNLISQRVRVVENAPVCRKYDIYGFYELSKNTLVFCTDKIKSHNNIEYDVNETLLHESVHVAQSCKAGSGYVISFGISKSHMPLTERRKIDINSAVRISGEEIRHIEHEAFWMEDKPDKVKYVVQKYCF
jgi:hypothetical protein